MLPNFNECWWDSIILDIFICNWFGRVLVAFNSDSHFLVFISSIVLLSLSLADCPCKCISLTELDNSFE